jgi:hypothetical protein
MSKKPSRMEMLGNLLTAMIAVIVGGSSNLLSEPSQRAHSIGRFNSLPLETLVEFRRGGKYFGLYAEVARATGCAPTNVVSIAHGRLQSSAIIAVLTKRIGEIDAQMIVAKNPAIPTLSPEVLAQMKPGGKYFGLYARVARSLGVNKSNVRRTAIGHVTSRRMLDAVWSEMARVDAELAARKVGA